jgi:hypothetical protein
MFDGDAAKAIIKPRWTTAVHLHSKFLH